MKHIAVVFIIVAVAVIYFYDDLRGVNPVVSSDDKKTVMLPPQSTLGNTFKDKTVPKKGPRFIEPPSHRLDPTDETGNPHFDRLTPEVQQALKDSLLLEGPMESITRPDGSIELPSDGRFTQMPVAVQMPNGSIEVREYSTIPKKQ